MLGIRAVLLLVYAATALALVHIAETRALALALLLAPPLIWLSLTDLDRHEIPDGAVITIGLTGLLFQWLEEGSILRLLPTFAAALALFVFLWALGEVWFRRTGAEGFGIGDAKLAAAALAVTGTLAIWPVLLLAALGGIAAHLVSRLRARPEQGAGIPFGPFLGYALFILTLMAPEGMGPR